MSESKKRGRKDAEEMPPPKGGKVAPATPKSAADAPAVSIAKQTPGEAPTAPNPKLAPGQTPTAPNPKLTPGEAPAVSIPKSTSVPPVSKRPSFAAAVPFASVNPVALKRIVSAAASAAVQSAAARQPPASSSLFDILRAEFRRRSIAVPAESLSNSSMNSAVHLAEMLYVDDILSETSGNVSLAGKIAKIT
jgi:hypothetical protein